MTDKQPLASLWTPCEERWPEDVSTMIRQTRALEDAVHVAVMPDVHLASGFCVGTVLATRRLIYPSAVGSDIGCGMLALPFHARAGVIKERVARRLLDGLRELVPAKRQRQPLIRFNNARLRLTSPDLDRVLMRDGLIQLGTLGSGNHFLELQRDTTDDRLWLMVHSGSRQLGQAISHHHTRHATHRSLGRPAIEADSPLGRAYLHDVRTARAYARLRAAGAFYGSLS